MAEEISNTRGGQKHKKGHRPRPLNMLPMYDRNSAYTKVCRLTQFTQCKKKRMEFLAQLME